MPRPIRVLILEDSENDCLLMVKELERGGFTPDFVRVDSARALTRELGRSQWDVILADYLMPNFTALDALAIVREFDLDCPFIVVSGSIGEDIAVEAMRSGAHDYIMKNNMTRLSAAVERELRQAEGRRLRCNAEMALKESNQTLWSLIKSSPLAIITVDLNRNVTMWSPAAERMFGWGEKEVLGATIPIVPKEKHPEFREIFSRALGGKPTAVFETQRKRKDGSYIDVSMTMAALQDSTGKVLGALAVYADLTEQKRTERAVREIESRSRAILKSAIDGIITIDHHGHIVEFNPAAERIFGHKREKVVGQEMTELVVPPSLREAHRKGLHRFLATGQGKILGQRLEMTALRADGTEIPVELSIQRIPLSEPPLFTGFVRDISERRQAEEALKKNEALLAKTQQIAHLGGWELELANLEDRNKNVLRWTDETFRIFGFEPGSVKVTNDLFFQCVHPEDRSKIMEAVSKALAEKKPYSIEHRILRPDGKERVVHEHADILFDEKTGRPLRMYGSVQDITERKKTEEARCESEERFRQITETIKEVFWLTNPVKNEMIYISPGYEEIWGCSRESLYQNPLSWAEAIHPEDRQRVLDAVLTKQAKGEFNEEYRIVRPDGRIRWIRDRAYPIRNDKGDVYRITGIAEDITQEKTLAEQLRQAQKMEAVGQLAGGIAHDFNNLLTAIGGYTDFVLEQVEPGSPLKAEVEEIKKATGRAAGLTRHLLAFSRKQMMQPVVLNLNELIKGMEGMLQRLIGKNIELATIPASGLAKVKVDPHQLEQVIMNLAVNARDAMPKGGRLTIETANAELDESFVQQHIGAQRGPYAMLAVTDSGYGMSAEVQKHLFEPFFTTKEKGKETGLGLSTVYGIVKQSGGYISVYSEPGRGSSFKIYLPRVVEEAPRKPIQVAPAKSTGGTETILLVEDEESVRALAAKILRAKGYTILEAGDGVEAQAVLRTHSGDLNLLLTDVVMPKMGGPELAKWVRGACRGVKVLFMTGYTDHSAFREGSLPPGTGLIQKPFSPQTLAQKVREILDSAKNITPQFDKTEKLKRPSASK